ncbi:MAG: DUF1566 domain-containing protein [Natronospirillum sp.]|uniref:Lcl C-terminal domain-containing protein n=1 Tax=Natronospirillum sp. TaxID=2812955 RepID=UPI0025D3B910|nr:DUF1566 domain-containing protein [Natronospirillum sp.]MCH8551228.1 DUF1566 domain-containing protein [Natronospirillum sp.]
MAQTVGIEDSSDQCITGILESTPSDRFRAAGDQSMVRDLQTGLVWQRCSLGQQWNGRSCVGNPAEMRWEEAAMAASQLNGWRLPSTEELLTLVESCRVKPTINLNAFPETPDGHFWSSNQFDGRNGYAWYVNFRYGFKIWFATDNRIYARLVRDH